MLHVHTEYAPCAIGPYSQAVVANGFAFISGQIPLDPHTMELKTGQFSEQAVQVFENFQAIVLASGSRLDRVVKLSIYLSDLRFFDEVNQVMQTYFQAPYPARAAFAVKTLPKGVDVEVEGIALVDG